MNDFGCKYPTKVYMLFSKKKPQTNKKTKQNKTKKRLNYTHLSFHVSIPKLCCPVSWSCRIHWLHLCRGVRLPPNEGPRYDTKQSDGEVPAMLKLWGMPSIPSLPSFPGPLWPGVVAPDRALTMGWIELTEYLC